MKVQLDTKAMNALFPEGSEARVQLQNAVIANFAQEIKDKHIAHEVQKVVRDTVNFIGTEAQIGRLIRERIQEEFKSVNMGWYNTVYKVEERGKIDKAISQHADSTAYEIRSKLIEDGKKLVDESLEKSKARLNEHIGAAVNKTEADMTRRIEQRVSAKLDEIIRLELAKILARPDSMVK